MRVTAHWHYGVAPPGQVSGFGHWAAVPHGIVHVFALRPTVLQRPPSPESMQAPLLLRVQPHDVSIPSGHALEATKSNTASQRVVL
jgi:hypothetical protein